MGDEDDQGDKCDPVNLNTRTCPSSDMVSLPNVKAGGTQPHNRTGRLVVEVSRLDAEGNPEETITRNISGPGVEMFDESGPR